MGYKAHCCCCGKFVGEFITREAAFSKSGYCLECQVKEVDKALNSVNPDIGR